MRESRTYGSVRAARGNSRPYRNEGARQSRRPSYLAPALSEIVPAGGISARPRISSLWLG